MGKSARFGHELRGAHGGRSGGGGRGVVQRAVVDVEVAASGCTGGHGGRGGAGGRWLHAGHVRHDWNVLHLACQLCVCELHQPAQAFSTPSASGISGIGKDDVDASEVEVDSDGEVDARDDLDACEVEIDSDEEVDARDDLDAHAVLAMGLVEEAVVLLLVLGLVRDVRNCVRCDEND
eukprot:1597619-Prymnesium_polylepis.1